MISRKLICLLPSFKSNLGHEISFVDTLNLLAKKNNLNIYYIVSTISKITNLDNLKKIIFTESYSIRSELYNFYLNIRSILNFFNTHNIKKKDSFYIDGYSFYFLFSFLISCLYLKKTFNIFIYCRYNYDLKKKFLFKTFIALLKFKKVTVYILTDNYPLYLILQKDFKVKTLLMPIPHTFELKRFKIKKFHNNKNINLLCPGQYREEKFGNNFNNFLYKNNSKFINVVINKDFKKKSDLNINFKKFGSNLNMCEYKKLIIAADLIVLPYDKMLYKFRTSGIFFEAITSQKRVIVTSGTSMANEFIKYDLKDLVIKDWANFDIFKNMKNIFSPNIDRNMTRMRIQYLKKHNKNNFVKILNKYI